MAVFSPAMRSPLSMASTCRYTDLKCRVQSLDRQDLDCIDVLAYSIWGRESSSRVYTQVSELGLEYRAPIPYTLKQAHSQHKWVNLV